MPTLEMDDISSTVDHINPASWSSDVSVAGVVLQTCWNQGCQLAELELTSCSISPLFAMMETTGGYDLLCLLGNSKIIAVNGSIHKDEVEEEMDAEETDLESGDGLPSLSDGAESEALHEENEDDLQLDIEDLTPDSINQDNVSTTKASQAWVNVETDATKPKYMRHKATVC
jgi:hypothetical protein